MITSLDEVRESKLCWPEHKPRCSHRTGSRFNTGLDRALQEIKEEIDRWKPLDYVISRNNQRVYAGDPAVALWWLHRLPKNQSEIRVLACDNYNDIGSNAHAIYLTLYAMRALERWGAYTAEQAAQGAKLALPPPPGSEQVDWRTLLGMGPYLNMPKLEQLDIANGRYKRASVEANGDQAMQIRLNLAIEQARAELKA